MHDGERFWEALPLHPSRITNRELRSVLHRLRSCDQNVHWPENSKSKLIEFQPIPTEFIWQAFWKLIVCYISNQLQPNPFSQFHRKELSKFWKCCSKSCQSITRWFLLGFWKCITCNWNKNKVSQKKSIFNVINEFSFIQSSIVMNVLILVHSEQKLQFAAAQFHFVYFFYLQSFEFFLFFFFLVKKN